jgi:hypothetical protein
VVSFRCNTRSTEPSPPSYSPQILCLNNVLAMYSCSFRMAHSSEARYFTYKKEGSNQEATSSKKMRRETLTPNEMQQITNRDMNLRIMHSSPSLSSFNPPTHYLIQTITPSNHLLSIHHDLCQCPMNTMLAGNQNDATSTGNVRIRPNFRAARKEEADSRTMAD